MRGDRVLRSELLALLQGGNAHMSFDQVAAQWKLAIMRQIMNIWPAQNRYLTGKPDGVEQP